MVEVLEQKIFLYAKTIPQQLRVYAILWHQAVKQQMQASSLYHVESIAANIQWISIFKRISIL